MKVLFCVRHNFYTSPGGAQIQILKTKKSLEKNGVICDITVSPFNVDYHAYDIIHLTDLTWINDLLFYMDEIKKSKTKSKIVLSTIYWPFDDYISKGAPIYFKFLYKFFGISFVERLKSFAKMIKYRDIIYSKGVLNNYINAQRSILLNVDAILPNSYMEYEAIISRLGVKDIPCYVVNNAVDVSEFDRIIDSEIFEKDENLILFVARIDPRKNQLGFLKSVKNKKLKIRFIGNYGPNSYGYYKKLKKIADRRGGVEFISHLSQEEVFRHMLQAKVHVLTSWIETPGLVSLEAAYAGCNLVVAEKGSVREYFKDYAYYCDPDDNHSINSALDKAVNSEFDEKIRKLIEQEYSWDRAAEQTLNAYKKVLNIIE